MTPIFPGFDFKATIAPPIISKSTGQVKNDIEFQLNIILGHNSKELSDAVLSLVKHFALRTDLCIIRIGIYLTG